MTHVQLDEALLEELDFRQLTASLRPGNLFPSRVGVEAATRAQAFPSTVASRLVHGFRAKPLEVVRVPRGDRTTRPAVDMPVDDLVVFAALRELIRARVHEGLVDSTGTAEEGQSYAEFERFPLTVEGVRYVLEADVAAFYEYVDHQTLSEEILGLTGAARLANAFSEAVEGWMDRPYGLPQGPPPSSYFADIYISPVSRALRRAGLRLSRYSDDFRVAVGSWRQGRQAQLNLEQALRQVGLVVASRKVRILKQATYSRYLADADDVRLSSPATTAAAEQLLAIGYEPDDVLEVPATAAEVSGAEQVLTEVLQTDRVTVTSTRLARAALRRLATAPSTAVLDHLDQLLDRYAHLTQVACGNLRYLGGLGQEAVPRAIGEWLERRWFRYPWQVGWLLHAANHAEARDGRLGTFAQAALFDESLPWFARGQAAITAARHGELSDVDRLFDAWERSPDATKQDLVAAALLGESAWRDDFIDGARTSPLLLAVASLDPAESRRWL